MIGIKKLDDLLEGGLKPGFFTLIEAHPMTGPEIFAKQIASTCDRDKVVYVATEETEDDVIDEMRANGWPLSLEVKDFSSKFSERLLREKQGELESRAAKNALTAKGLDISEIIQSGSHGHSAGKSIQTDFLMDLLKLFSSFAVADKVIVHSLNFFLNLYDVRDVTSVLHAIRTINRKNGKLFFATISPHIYENEVKRIEPFADMIIELKADVCGDRIKNMLYVKKVRGWSHKPIATSYDIAAEGIRIDTMEKVI